MRKKILIISDYDLYSGKGASFERIKCYAKAVPELDFIALHIDIDYHKPINFVTDKEQKNLFFSDGIFQNNGLIYRNTIKYFDFFRAYNLCRFICRNYKIEEASILLYGSLFPLYFWAIFLLKERKKFKVIIEKNELQTGVLKNAQIRLNVSIISFLLIFPFRFLAAFLSDYLTGRADKIIAISSRIREKYHKKTFCSLVPVLVNIERFEKKIIEQHSDYTNFIYLGLINKSKDGISELLISLAQLSTKYSNFHLDIVGEGNRHYVRAVNRFILKNDLSAFVMIKKSVKGAVVPSILKDYDYGLLIRERNTQTQYGFSTKLGEYMAAGLPVIFTDVSDNLLFLNNNDHGFVVPFPLSNNLTNVLERAVLTNYTKRKEMKENARVLAREKFDFRNYSDDLRKIFL